MEKREFNDRERKIIAESSSIQDLDYKINAQFDHTPLGSILLVELPSHFFDSDKNIGIGQFRFIFYAKGTSICDVMNIVRQAVLGENVINTMTSSIREPIKIHDVDKSKWSQRKGVPSPEYDILLSLLVPEPELNLVTWDIENAIQHILQPFLDEIGDLCSFTGKNDFCNFLILFPNHFVECSNDFFAISYFNNEFFCSQKSSAIFDKSWIIVRSKSCQ